MRVGTTFSGLGAVSVAAERLGMEPVFHADIEKNSKAVLAHHWPEVPDLGDIKEIRHAPDHDILTAGFPCQDLSVAGKRAGLEGERSGLFWEVVRILEGSRPPWFVLENVPGLLSSNGGRDMGAVIRALGDIGYSVAWRVLDARFFGVPQRRRRVFLVGHLGRAARAGAVLLEREGGGWDHPAIRRTGPRATSAVGQGPQGSGVGAAVGNAYQSGRGWWNDGEGVGGTLAARDWRDAGQVVVVVELGSLRVRRLTPRECERLQGLPDDHTLVPSRTLKDGRVKMTSDSARYALVGNSAAVPVLEWILERIQRVEES